MSCKLCTEKLSPSNFFKLRGACGPCRKNYEQMRAGFRGVVYEQQEKVSTWDNSEAYNEWVGSLGTESTDQVSVKSNEEHTKQRCDVRDMRGVVGMPKFHPLEAQVYTAWVEEGVKDDKMKEVLGLTYAQIQHVKSVVRMRLRKQMSFFKAVQKVDDEAAVIKKRKGL